MKVRMLSLAACVLFVGSTINADEPVPYPLPHADTPVPFPPPPGVVPAQRPSPYEPQPRQSAHAHDLSRVEHLRRAAEHLEAAGAEEMAREVREEADALLQASVEQLNQKREQVARLQREIAELEEVTGCDQQVMLSCRVVDVDLAKLRQLGFSWSSMNEDGVIQTSLNGASPFRFGPNDTAMIDGLIDGLVREDLATILAEPVLVTLNGRPASLHSGGEFPVIVPDGAHDTRVQFREFGLRLEAVPSILDDGRVRLAIAPELSTRDFENAVTINGNLIPGLNTRRLNTQFDVEFGETVALLIPGAKHMESVRQASAEDGAPGGTEMVTIICVTPERVRPMHQYPVAEPPPAPVRVPETPAY